MRGDPVAGRRGGIDHRLMRAAGRHTAQRRHPRRPIAVALLALVAFTAGWLATAHRTGTTARLRESDSPAAQAGTLQRQYVAAVRTILPSIVQISTPEGLDSGIVLDTK